MTRNEDIPLRLVMPRYFTCPNIKSDIYDLDFQIRYKVHLSQNILQEVKCTFYFFSVEISFANGYSISECMDVTLKRLI